MKDKILFASRIVALVGLIGTLATSFAYENATGNKISLVLVALGVIGTAFTAPKYKGIVPYIITAIMLFFLYKILIEPI